MPAFVATLVGNVTTESVAFLTEVINSYWLTILGVVFVGFMIGLFWRLAHRITGR